MVFIPYVIFTASLAAAAYAYSHIEDEKTRQQLFAATIVIFFIFLGLRGFVQTDWTVYYPWFDMLTISDFINWELKLGQHEPGFVLLSVICKNFYDSYHFLVIVVAIINTVLLCRFLRQRTDNIILGLLFFAVFEGIVIYFNLLRNSISILIFINALKYIEERRPIPYFIACLLSLSFHFTSVLFIPLYFFFHKHPNKWVYLAIFLACNVVFLSKTSVVVLLSKLVGMGDFIEAKLESYTEDYTESTGISIGYLERLMTGVLIFLKYETLQNERKNNAVIINGMLAYFIFFLGFSEFAVMSRRLSTLFIYAYWIVWIDLLRCFYYVNNQRLYKGVIILYCLLKVGLGCNTPEFRYENLLFGASSYNERLTEFNKTFQDKR